MANKFYNWNTKAFRRAQKDFEELRKSSTLLNKSQLFILIQNCSVITGKINTSEYMIFFFTYNFMQRSSGKNPTKIFPNFTKSTNNCDSI